MQKKCQHATKIFLAVYFYFPMQDARSEGEKPQAAALEKSER